MQVNSPDGLIAIRQPDVLVAHSVFVALRTSSQASMPDPFLDGFLPKLL
jgi:hypothetical protein